MVVFDLADAPWFPLLMIGVLAVVMVALFWSMRREIGKIRVPKRGESSKDPEGR